MDHYRVLQVTRDAEPEVIERAYKALCLKYHPDVAGDSPTATRKMQRINEAYRTLGSSERRRAYDAALSPEQGHGWDRFLADGLVGLFADRYIRR